MPVKCHHVRLEACQRDELKSLIASGTSPSRKLTRAQILLNVNTTYVPTPIKFNQTSATVGNRRGVSRKS